MTPFTHGATGILVGLLAKAICPNIEQGMPKGLFLALSAVAGQIPDIDCVLALLGKEIRGENPLLQHRGIVGHSALAQIFFSLFFPFILGFQGWQFWQWVFFLFVQIGLHLLEDCLDGSDGIFYFAPYHNKPVRLFALCKNVDNAVLALLKAIRKFGLLRICGDRRIKEENASAHLVEVVERFASEAIFNLPIFIAISLLTLL